jgi:hypothetical protein
MERDEEQKEIEYFAGGLISSKNEKVPKWLFYLYILSIAWGIVWFFLYWNGSTGWIDRGGWHRLQKAANTVYPIAPFSPSKDSEEGKE